MSEGGVTEHSVNREHQAPPVADTHDLAVSLAPVLQQQCQGRLGAIEWFRAPWQRGGAATGFSTWEMDDGRRVGVLVKLPVGPVEYRWTAALGAVPEGKWASEECLRFPTPRVLACGQELNGYDLAWSSSSARSGASPT